MMFLCLVTAPHSCGAFVFVYATHIIDIQKLTQNRLRHFTQVINDKALIDNKLHITVIDYELSVYIRISIRRTS